MCIISFLSCKNYYRPRNNLFDKIFMLDLVNIATSLLLYGNDNLLSHINNIIFGSVNKTIDKSSGVGNLS